ncbi:MAG: hypothetical protein FK734_06960 [Asgard group archaeon]|nr:hypothetical protein [Asgard group archaeon]
MSKKTTILMSNVAVLLVILFVSSSFTTQGVIPGFVAGEVYYFSEKADTEVIYTNTEYNTSDTLSVVTQFETSINVTGIDIRTERFYAFYTNNYGTSYFSLQYGVDFITTNYFHLPNLLYADYVWDYSKNETVLQAFDFGFYYWYLVEPDWAIFNEEFVEIFNESEIIDTVDDPYQPITYNITLGDFLSSLNGYSVNGKNNLADGLAQCDSKNMKFTFYFDLTNVYKYAVFNATLGYNQYYLFNDFTFEYGLEFKDDGILNHFWYQYIYDKTQDALNLQYDYLWEVVYGELKALSADFPYWLVFPTLAISSLVITIKRRRSNK